MIHFYEHLLGDILRVISIVHETIGKVVYPPHVKSDKLTKGCMVSTLSIQYQLPLPVSGHSVEFLFQAFDD
jgi:hypothetical protein